ncbi:MAG TPA: MBL fold metallo-hydrolase, partial [Polyangiaceae bacterium]|nr:MBL fold metallo-hydrolase [Polyangiaceae bacterium]
MQVLIVPCLKDNYAYVLLARGSKRAIVVDPGEAAPVAQVLHERELELGAILATHHHPDHVGGNSALLHRYPGACVFGHASDRGRIAEQTEFLSDGQSIEVDGL